jgi:Double-GTPase 2
VIVVSQDIPRIGDSGGHRITVWGAPSTGKTTFLAAINVALERQHERWRVIGADEASADALTMFERALITERVFPEATQRPELYRWRLRGKAERLLPFEIRGYTLWHRRREVPAQIPLEVVDAPGGSASSAAGQGRSQALIENIEQSKGIAFFFDPVREKETNDAFEHTHSVVNKVAQRMQERGTLLPDGRLPHHVAVCVTKFDELNMARTAELFGMLERDERGVPRVPDTDARDFVYRLCRQFDNLDTSLIFDKLERAFDPERMKYYVTSAIGFYVNPATGRCDPDDFQNHIPAANGQPPRIRGDVIPVNVAEPVLWLAQVR